MQLTLRVGPKQTCVARARPASLLQLPFGERPGLDDVELTPDPLPEETPASEFTQQNSPFPMFREAKCLRLPGKNHPEIFAANTEGNVPIFWLGVRR